MKRLLLALAFVGVTWAQSAPNCNQQNAILSSATAGPNYNATSVKCVAWTFSYYAEGFSALSIQVESAPDVAGAPGAFTVIGATGNPATGTGSGNFSFNGYFPWLRVNLTSATGVGFVNYTLIGNSYVSPSNSSGAGGGSSGGIVFGQDSPGAAPTKNPIQDSGVDGGGLVRRLLTDTAGDLNVEGAVADGSTPKNAVVVGGKSGGGNVLTVGADNNAGIGNAALDVGFANTGFTVSGNTSPTSLLSSATHSNFRALAIFDMGLSNGTNIDFRRSASLTNFPTSVTRTAANVIGSTIVEKNARWSVVSQPAAGTQASASLAAEASVRHVIDCVSFAATEAGTAVTNTDLVVNVRDGATGAGTVIWTWVVSDLSGTATINTQYIAPHSVCGLQLTGTTNTAMTVEFSAGLTNLNESVSFSGFNVN